jgi:hypothetical protein
VCAVEVVVMRYSRYVPLSTTGVWWPGVAGGGWYREGEKFVPLKICRIVETCVRNSES